ncbi:MAG: phosphoribosylformylglycinamidine synthase I [Patescibacteria group bacterium]
MKIALIQFPGINREYDAARFLQRAGFETEIFRWNREAKLLDDFDGYVIPGGFSYEDRSRAGVIPSLDPLMNKIKEQAEKGKPVLGICNGCQILMETGLVPGLPDYQLAGAMAENVRVKQGKILGTAFYNDWVRLKNVSAPGRTIFNSAMKPDETFSAIVANGEGRFVIDEKILAQMYKNDQVILKYCDDQGEVRDEFPVNPSGAVDSIAGICNLPGNVMALMPHAENSPEGMPLFISLFEGMKKGFRLNRKSKLSKITFKRDLKKYKAPTNCLELIVDLIITDKEASSVNTALKNIGFNNVEVSRKVHWELCHKNGDINIEDLKDRVIKSDELLNTNKEFVVDDFKPAKNENVIKISYSQDYVGKSKLNTLKDRLGFSEIRDVKKSIIWQIRINEDDDKKREEIYNKVLDTNIFYNPYSQDCKLYK